MTPRRGRFARDAWAGLPSARQEAARRGSWFIGTQHVLFALLDNADGEASAALRAGGVRHDSAASALDAIEGLGAWPDAVGIESVQTSDRVQQILEDAAARGTDGHGMVRDRDVLRALLLSDDPAVGHLIVTIVSNPGRVLATLEHDAAVADGTAS